MRDEVLLSIFLIVISYIIGSIPFGVIISRLKGIDPRKVGSGNIGTTNVLRSAGVLPAIFTLLLDGGKGAISVLISKAIDPSSVFAGYIAGFASIMGHNFPVFLRFKGGKGVATTFGVLFVILPEIGIISMLIWLIVAISTRYSSLSALISLGLLPVTVFVISPTTINIIFSLLLSILIIIRHRYNIKMLISGRERRIGEKVA